MRTLTEQAAGVAAGEVSPVELVERALTEVERTEHDFNLYTRVFPDAAIDEARRLAGQDPVGPLHGVPLVVKDLFDVAGVPTTGCCDAYHDRVARRDAAVVEALRAAGAIIVAKTNQHELAFGATNLISSFGPTRNPWDPRRITGGSSGGSAAAVAARAVLGGLGSDTGGSIRVPSSLCGVTGLKPTHGAVSLRGAMPLAPSLDTAGPVAVSSADCILIHRAIVGFDPDDPFSVDGRPVDPPATLERIRIALPRTFLEGALPAVVAGVEAVAAVLESAGCQIDEIEGPDPDEAWAILSATTPVEAAQAFADLEGHDGVHPETATLLELGRGIPGTTYVEGQIRRRRFRRDFEWALTAADALLAPTTPYPAPRADEGVVEADGHQLPVSREGLLRLTAPANIAGLPALAFPVGFDTEGLPLGAQLIGRPWSEEVLCALGAAYQEATQHHLRAP